MTAAEPHGSARSASTSFWRRLLSRTGLDLRHGEGTSATLLFASFFLIVTFQYTAKSVRQSTFIDALGAEMLPVVYMLVAICSYPFLRLYGRFADRLQRQHLIAATCALIATSLVLFWWLYQFSWQWVPMVFYIWISIVFVMTVSQFWSFTNHVFDPRQAKRLFGFIGAGGLLGGMAGGQVARFVTQAVGTRFALLVAATLLLTVVGLIYLVHRIQPSDEARVAGAAGLEKLDKARGGFETIRRSRQLQLIAAVLTLTVIVAQVVDLQFNWAVERATDTLDQRTAFFGNFYSIMSISAFLFQLVFTARIHRVLGVGFALRVLPVTMAVGTGALFITAASFPAAVVAAALVLKVGENGLRYSLDQATRELLFLPVPSRARLKAKAFIDVFVQRGAKGLAALLLLPVTFGLLAPVNAGWISLGLIAVWIVVTVATQREYVRSFRTGLKERTVDAALPIDLADITTLEMLVQSLGSSDRRQVLTSLDLLASHGRGHLVPPLLLYHDDPQIRQRTLQILAEVGRRDAAPLVERRLSDTDPDVRAEAIRVLADLRHEDVCALMLPRLQEANPSVRAAAVACVANQGGQDLVAQATTALNDMLSDAEAEVRAEAAKAIGAIHEPQFQELLVELLYDGEPLVVREAISAVRRRVYRNGPNPLYIPTLIALQSNRRVKHEAREALVAFGEPVIPSLVYFMNDPEEEIWVRRALPKTLARIGCRAAAQALLDCLDKASDSFLRRKLLEAMGSLQDQYGEVHAERIAEQVQVEARLYLENLSTLCCLGARERASFEGPRIVWKDELTAPNLLDRLLLERADDNLSNLFSLLALLYPAADIWAAHRSLLSDTGALRSHALEYLDNTLSKDLRRHLFAAIGDHPVEERLERAERLFGVSLRSKTETLSGLIRTPNGDPDARRLAAAALYAVYTDGVSELYPRVREVASQAQDPFIRETAAWVVQRLRPKQRRGRSARTGEPS